MTHHVCPCISVSGGKIFKKNVQHCAGKLPESLLLHKERRVRPVKRGTEVTVERREQGIQNR